MPKRLVVSLVRVSTEEQEWERQRRKKQRILRENDLEELQEFALKISGTAVEKTQEYQAAIKLLHRRDVVGMVVPSIDRWFRYKLLSEIGRYVEPFEQMLDGQSNKRIFCNLGALDLRNRGDQDKILDAVRYASKEREVITERLTEGKDIGREDPQVKIDTLPTGIGFTPYEEGENRGDFFYNDFANHSVKPLFWRFHAGEPIFHLTKELGFGSVNHARHTLRNVWYIGYKHRTRHISKKEWDDELNRFRRRGLTKHENPILVPTNLAKTPLVPKWLFDAVQDKLAVRKTEYDKRNKIVDEFLASPLLRCKICGARMYGRRGSGGRPDTYTCATRYRTQSCDEPIYRRKELDREVAIRLMFLLSNPKIIDQKIEESLSLDRQAEAQLKVEMKQRIVADLEKKANRVRKAIEETGDRDLPTRLLELNGELASARNDLAAAKESVPEAPVIDRTAFRRQIQRDVLAFHKKSHAEQKEILSKYVKSITAEVDDSLDHDPEDDEPDTRGRMQQPHRPETDSHYAVTLHLKFSFPASLVHQGTRRTKSESFYSAFSTLR